VIRVSIVGGSGYSGGELLRLLHGHPAATVQQVTSERFAGKPVSRTHPNLRKVVDLKYCAIGDLGHCDVLFLCLPHGEAMRLIGEFSKLAERIIDLSGDFRLSDGEVYKKWYGREHLCPEWLPQFVYGIPEISRTELIGARYVAGAGCNATAAILGLRPLYRSGLVEQVVIEVKAGSSEAGNTASDASHHPERSGAVRSYKPSGHRHIAEIKQALAADRVHFSATSIDMVRGILATCHVFMNQDVPEKEIWGWYRDCYKHEPFIRIVKERSGIHRYPEPKLLSGSNYCDIGFERDADSNRVVVISAIDNLMKGAAGQAIQAFNIMHEIAETTGLEFPGLHPI